MPRRRRGSRFRLRVGRTVEAARIRASRVPDRSKVSRRSNCRRPHCPPPFPKERSSGVARDRAAEPRPTRFRRRPSRSGTTLSRTRARRALHSSRSSTWPPGNVYVRAARVPERARSSRSFCAIRLFSPLYSYCKKLYCTNCLIVSVRLSLS